LGAGSGFGDKGRLSALLMRLTRGVALDAGKKKSLKKVWKKARKKTRKKALKKTLKR
jgi:hypothetical protein